MTTKLSLLEDVLNGLMEKYKERVPDVQRILSVMISGGLISDSKDIENDHIAFRTLDVPFLGIKSLEKIFLHLGYIKKDYYFFPEKKLNAFWYAPPDNCFPRIFISELRVKDLSMRAQNIIHRYTGKINSDPVDALNLNDSCDVDNFLHSGLWPIPSWSDYSDLMAESEYAAWVIYNRYYLNHFTISVHNLPANYATIAEFNDFLEIHNFKLNDSGGKIKISKDNLLLQSSTIARLIPAKFSEGSVHQIPGSYIEFAERRPLTSYSNLPIDELRREHRREGFEAANANRIFESTYQEQTKRSV